MEIIEAMEKSEQMGESEAMKEVSAARRWIRWK
jgi:hypothetical protein